MILCNFISQRAFTVYMEIHCGLKFHFGQIDRSEIYTEVRFTSPELMWSEFYPDHEVKSQTSLSSLRVSWSFHELIISLISLMISLMNNLFMGWWFGIVVKHVTAQFFKKACAGTEVCCILLAFIFRDLVWCLWLIMKQIFHIFFVFSRHWIFITSGEWFPILNKKHGIFA